MATLLAATLAMLPNSAHDRIAPHGRTTSMASGGAVSRLLGSEDPVRAEARRLLAERGPATYIGDILAERDGALTRWPDRDGKPLVVWIQDKTNIPGWMASYVDDVRGAFQDWDAVKVPVHFAFTTDSAKADVHVTFIDHFDEPISGRTKWERDEDWWITDANIVLAVAHHDGVMLDDDAMHAMTLHEVGHLIGLDHTKDPLSVMAPRVRVRELSRADRATAQLLYALPPGPMNK